MIVKLPRRYTESNFEDAFAELVTRPGEHGKPLPSGVRPLHNKVAKKCEGSVSYTYLSKCSCPWRIPSGSIDPSIAVKQIATMNMLKKIKMGIITCAAVVAALSAYALYEVSERGAWPESWPKELESLRNQSCTLTHQTAEIHIIPFTNRAEFEAAWPHIVSVKSQGAPITLLSAPDKRYPEAKRDEPIKAGVYILTPLTGTLVTPESTRYPPGSESRIRGGQFLRIGPPWPDEVKSARGVLPEYVVYKDGKWTPAEGQPKDRNVRRARTDIELLVDGDIIDSNWIHPPTDTPIIDKRSLAAQIKAAQHAWCSQPKTADGESHVWRVRSCKNCYSVQGIEALRSRSFTSFDRGRIVGKEWKWQYQGKDYLTCQHERKDGVRRTVPNEIASGQVVLVRKDGVYGAFVLTTQNMKPGTAEFVWRYGTDNTGGFNTSDPNVKWSSTPKSVQNRKGELMIEFGPFEIQWSRGAGGKGWIYYGKFPGDELAENDLAICVTDEQSFDPVRPQDAKWEYRRSPVDGL